MANEDLEEAPADVQVEVSEEDQLSTPDVVQEDPPVGAVTGIGTPPDTPGDAPQTQVFTRSGRAVRPRQVLDL